MSEENIEGSQGPIEIKQEREDRIVRELRKIIDDLYEVVDYDVMLEISNRLKRRSQWLEENFPDFRQYRTWHILGGSSDITDKPMKFDFEDKFSLEVYIRNLDKEYRGK